jgi:hypothetical protein
MSIATEIKTTEEKVRAIFDDLIENHMSVEHNGTDVYHHKHWEIASKLLDSAMGDIESAVKKLSRASFQVEKAEA